MSFSLRQLLCLAVVAVFATPLAAHADMPGNGDKCDMQDGCVQCYNSFSEEDGDASEYDSCVAAAEADGLQLSCSQLQGAGDQEFWCPEGVDANAGCSASAGPVTQGAALLVTCAAASLLVALRRTRRRRVPA